MQNNNKKNPHTFNFYLGPKNSSPKENANRNFKKYIFKELKI